jgi:hypothetical protein
MQLSLGSSFMARRLVTSQTALLSYIDDDEDDYRGVEV